MAMDYTITAIAKPSREVRLTIHFPSGDKPMSFSVPDGVDSLPEARDFIEQKVRDATSAWRVSNPVAPPGFGGNLDAVVGVRRTVADA
jgi:hypothetical protein